MTIRVLDLLQQVASFGPALYRAYNSRFSSWYFFT